VVQAPKKAVEGRLGERGIHEGRWTNVRIQAKQDRVTALGILKGS